MSPRETRRVGAFVDALIGGKRPPRFPATDDEAEAIRAAVALRAETDDAPAAAFVDELGRRLRAAAAGGAETPEDPQRRRFLKAAGLAAAAVATGALGEHFLAPAAATPTGLPQPTDSGTMVPDAGRWTAVARLADLPVGQAKRFSAGAVEGFVINRGGGSVDALSAVCTHQGCILQAVANRLDCPCHGASFGLHGEVIRAEYALAPLPALQARVNGEDVEVYTA